ncbi:MAG: GAF domain-containing protein [Patescibacteria group bacterium]|jgi:GAF domain-containing protein
MKNAPIPENENERLAVVRALEILDTPPDERFDRLTREAIQRLHVPISTISIIDKDREWFKSCIGLESWEGPRSSSFCGHALVSDKKVFIVEDTKKDPTFSDNPMVTGPPHIRFYAGVALHDEKQHLPVGVFCVKDTKPRNFSLEETGTLLELADRAERELNAQG